MLDNRTLYEKNVQDRNQLRMFKTVTNYDTL